MTNKSLSETKHKYHIIYIEWINYEKITVKKHVTFQTFLRTELCKSTQWALDVARIQPVDGGLLQGYKPHKINLKWGTESHNCGNGEKR